MTDITKEALLIVMEDARAALADIDSNSKDVQIKLSILYGFLRGIPGVRD